jgi:hypothetical protein
MMEWQPIETAPKFDRFWICGWKKPTRSLQGYWWFEEYDGENLDGALYWCPIVLPDFPSPPVQP